VSLLQIAMQYVFALGVLAVVVGGLVEWRDHRRNQKLRRGSPHNS
jgi:hypothetical protein